MGRNVLMMGAACAWLLGCASVFLQTDDFPDKLKQGCTSLQACERLETEAKSRVARCKDNTIGYIRCSDASADLTVASGYANEWRERIAKDDQERGERRTLEENAKREEAQELADQQREDQEKKQRDEQASQLKDRDDAQAAAIHAQHLRDVEYLRLLGSSGREQKVRGCVRDNGRGQCTDLVMQISEAIGDEKETARLAQINETPIPPPPPPTVPVAPSRGNRDDSSGTMAQCCDGTASPSCACPGHRGCCSHHGGVCGCN